MSSSPECQKCGDYIHYGPVICGKCAGLDSNNIVDTEKILKFLDRLRDGVANQNYSAIESAKSLFEPWNGFPAKTPPINQTCLVWGDKKTSEGTVKSLRLAFWGVGADWYSLERPQRIENVTKWRPISTPATTQPKGRG